MDKIDSVYRVAPAPAHNLLLSPHFEGSADTQAPPPAGTGRFPPLRWVSLSLQWWPVALKTPMHGVIPRQKVEGWTEGDTSRQVPSPETPHIWREACATWTQRKYGAKSVPTKSASNGFPSQEEWGGIGFQWQLRGAQGPKSEAEGRERRRRQDRQVANSLQAPAHITLTTLLNPWFRTGLILAFNNLFNFSYPYFGEEPASHTMRSPCSIVDLSLNQLHCFFPSTWVCF